MTVRARALTNVSIQKLTFRLNFRAKCGKSQKLFVILPQNKRIMIAEGNTTASRQTAKTVSVKERVMASTVSVDEYFDELISHVHQDYADL